MTRCEAKHKFVIYLTSGTWNQSRVYMWLLTANRNRTILCSLAWRDVKKRKKPCKVFYLRPFAPLTSFAPWCQRAKRLHRPHVRYTPTRGRRYGSPHAHTDVRPGDPGGDEVHLLNCLTPFCRLRLSRFPGISAAVKTKVARDEARCAVTK